MKGRIQGFTLLEIMMVLLLLGVVTRLVVAALPESKTVQPLEQLQHSARWAWEQAQLEARIWRMQLNADSWQLSTLAGGEQGESGPLPGTVWHPVMGALAQGRIADGELRLRATALPATLWFLPDGDMTVAEIEFTSASGEIQHLTLNPAHLSATLPL
jgi:prepilin-type N-terminal cleavage/methylation domain-containing protein